MNLVRLLELRRQITYSGLCEEDKHAVWEIFDALIPPETVEECDAEIGEAFLHSHQDQADAGYYEIGQDEFHFDERIHLASGERYTGWERLPAARRAARDKRITALLEGK